MKIGHFTVPGSGAPVPSHVPSSRLPVGSGTAWALGAVLAVAAVCAPAAARAAADAIGTTLVAEYALQAGRLDEAAAAYLAAARAVPGDAGLAERATRIALLAGKETLARDALALWRERAPPALSMRAAEATLALRARDPRTSRRVLESLMRDPDPRGWRYALSVLGNETGDRAQGARVLAGLLEADAVPPRLQPWLAFGGLAQQLGAGELTARIVDEVVARFPGEPRVALLRASQLREAGRIDEARAAIAAIAPAAAADPELRVATALEYDQLGDPVAGASVMATGPQDERSYALRAALLAKAEDRVRLRALYEELKPSAGDPDPAFRLLLGQTAEYLELPAEALGWYRSVPGGAQRWQARLREAKVLYDLDRRDEALSALRGLQQDASAAEDIRRDAYLLEAELGREAGDADAEHGAYARGLAAFPDDGALLYARGLMWERRDDIARAEADLRRILVADPENVVALNALGYTLADRTTRYAEALELIDRARVAEPGNAAIIDSHGWVLYRLGRNEEALAALQRAYTLQKDAEIAAHLAEVLWVMGRREEARTYFEEARRLEPENRSLQRALEKTGA